MSGPKSSRYSLTAEQLKIILKEQERIRRENEEKARKKREYKEAHTYISSIKTKLERHVELIKTKEKKLAYCGSDSSTLKERYQAFFSLVNQTLTLCNIKSNTTHTSLMNIKKEVNLLFNEIVSQEGDIIAETDEFILDHKLKEDSIITSGMKLSFDKVGVIETTQNPIFTETTTKLEQLLNEDLSVQLVASVKSALELSKTIETVPLMQNFAIITVAPLIKKCQDYISFAKENREQYNSMLDKYTALCKQIGVQEKQMELSEKGLIELEKSITDLECQANQDAEQAYIIQSVDEVMTEMGYEVIGNRHVRKKSGKEFRSKLFTYEDGTVINMTEASNGQITMEIGGTDIKDRLPNANERVSLRKTMESFCRDFHEIEERLSERGVVLNTRLLFAPPEEAYAQIININDFDIVEKYQTTVSNNKTAHKKNLKHMRDE